MSRCPSRYKLQASVEAKAEKRQKEYEESSKWNTQTQYYKNWDRHNNMYQTWTSPEYYDTSNQQYSHIKRKERKQISLEERRQKLRKLLFDEEQQLETEMMVSPREHRDRKHPLQKRASTQVLKEVNAGLKLAEEDRRRHEAELQLYNQWRANNPIIKDFESNQNKAGLKLAWLDQQIEKRMQKEKAEAEVKQMIEQRNKAIKEDEELDRRDREAISQREKELMDVIRKQMEDMKIKEKEAEALKRSEQSAIEKKAHLEELLELRQHQLKKSREEEIALYNINQSKIKLRKKARDVEDQLKADEKLIEDLQQSQTLTEVQNEGKKRELRQRMDQFLNYVKEQKKLELQRQKHISFIFDSEAKSLWEKQDRLWRTEEDSREKLLQQVLDGLKQQIQEKINKNLEQQRDVLKHREEILQGIESNDFEMKKLHDELKEQKWQRKLELDQQIQDKRLEEKQRQLEEEARRQQELEHIRQEEEKIKHEILKLQKRQYPVQQKYNRRIIW